MLLSYPSDGRLTVSNRSISLIVDLKRSPPPVTLRCCTVEGRSIRLGLLGIALALSKDLRWCP